MMHQYHAHLVIANLVLLYCHAVPDSEIDCNCIGVTPNITEFDHSAASRHSAKVFDEAQTVPKVTADTTAKCNTNSQYYS